VRASIVNRRFNVRRRLNYANVTATLALFFALSGGALAAKHYLVNSTKQISPKVLKALQGKAGAAGAQGKEGPIGKEGPAGKEGSKGKEGAAATTLWARVKFDGSLKKGSGVVSTEKISSKGGYEVVFNRNVSACAYVATPGDATVTNSFGEYDLKNKGFILTEPRLNEPNAVFVETRGGKEEEAEESFHLVVFC
jgi:hypothetical protein